MFDDVKSSIYLCSPYPISLIRQVPRCLLQYSPLDAVAALQDTSLVNSREVANIGQCQHDVHVAGGEAEAGGERPEDTRAGPWPQVLKCASGTLDGCPAVGAQVIETESKG